jgi:integrase
MTKRTAANERIKHRYLQFLRDVKGRDEASIDAVAKAIDRFEEDTKRRDFKKFRVEQVVAFKAHLAAALNARTGEPLSASTVYSTLAALKAFFTWLAQERGYSSRIKLAHVEYFNAPDNLSRVATARRYKACPTIPQIRAMLDTMPGDTEIERRDRALVAFAILSGARDSAIVSFKLKHIDLANELIEQDARDVRTKRAKTFTTWFSPLVMTFARFSSIGSGSFGSKRVLGRRTRFSRSRRSRPATISNFVPWASIAHIGRMRIPSGLSFARPARGPGCPISTLTPFETRLCKLRMSGNWMRNGSKRGPRI